MCRFSKLHALAHTLLKVEEANEVRDGRFFIHRQARVVKLIFNLIFKLTCTDFTEFIHKDLFNNVNKDKVMQ